MDAQNVSGVNVIKYIERMLGRGIRWLLGDSVLFYIIEQQVRLVHQLHLGDSQRFEGFILSEEVFQRKAISDEDCCSACLRRKHINLCLSVVNHFSEMALWWLKKRLKHLGLRRRGNAPSDESLKVISSYLCASCTCRKKCAGLPQNIYLLCMCPAHARRICVQEREIITAKTFFYIHDMFMCI